MTSGIRTAIDYQIKMVKSNMKEVTTTEVVSLWYIVYKIYNKEGTLGPVIVIFYPTKEERDARFFRYPFYMLTGNEGHYVRQTLDAVSFVYTPNQK